MKTLPPISTAFTRLQLVLEQRQVSLTLLHTYRISTRLTPFFPTLTYRSPTFFFSFLSFFPPFFFSLSSFFSFSPMHLPPIESLTPTAPIPSPSSLSNHLSNSMEILDRRTRDKERKKEERKINIYISLSYFFQIK